MNLTVLLSLPLNVRSMIITLLAKDMSRNKKSSVSIIVSPLDKIHHCLLKDLMKMYHLFLDQDVFLLPGYIRNRKKSNVSNLHARAI